jgi:uncharacterized protein
MIAVDTNILVHAHRSDSPWHDAASSCLSRVAQAPWAIPWPCVHEFLAIVTHPRVFNPPSPQADACRTMVGWLEAPTLVLLSELDGYWDILSSVLGKSRVTGPRVHDARIAALCMQHGVGEIWTADRDFGRFAGIRVRNPLVEST